MHIQLIAGVLGALSLGQPADTTIALDGETKLTIEIPMGSITVQAWDRAAVEISRVDGEAMGLAVSRAGQALRIRPEEPEMADLDLELMVPAAMALELRAPFGDISIEGTRGDVTVESVEGDVTVAGGAAVVIRSVEGDVTVEGARGGVSVSTAAGDVQLGDVAGALSVEAIDGDVVVEGADADKVQVTTVDGDVLYDGPIRDEGRYRFATHDGDIVCTVPEGANATVSVATFAGDFEASFPIAIQSSVDRRFQFTLGSGSARLELEAFEGEILLIRPGEGRPEDDD